MRRFGNTIHFRKIYFRHIRTLYKPRGQDWARFSIFIFSRVPKKSISLIPTKLGEALRATQLISAYFFLRQRLYIRSWLSPTFDFHFFNDLKKISIFLISTKPGETFLAKLSISGNYFLCYRDSKISCRTDTPNKSQGHDWSRVLIFNFQMEMLGGTRPRP